MPLNNDNILDGFDFSLPAQAQEVAEEPTESQEVASQQTQQTQQAERPTETYGAQLQSGYGAYALGEAKKAENHINDINALTQKYGIDKYKGSPMTIEQLNAQMDKDGVPTTTQRDVQLKWLESFDTYIKYSAPPQDKARLRGIYDRIANSELIYKENTLGNQGKEAWDRSAVATEAIAEELGNQVVSQFDKSDADLLKEARPDLYKKVQEAGGLDQLRAYSIGSDDITGTASMAAFGASPEQRKFAREVLDEVARLRSADVNDRQDPMGELVTMRDGSQRYMTNAQAADYKSKLPSAIAGNREAQQDIEKSFGNWFTFNGMKLLFNNSVQSTVRNAPTTIAGTAAMVVNPVAGLLIMNSGNITDQRLQYTLDAVNQAYKEKYGEDADVSQLSPQEYIAFSSELARNGVIDKAQSEAIKTGLLMTAAGTITGGLVDKLGGAKAIVALGKAGVAGKIASGLTKAGLKFSDEGLQEVSETLVENARKGNPLDQGLADAFLLGALSIENVSQHTARGVNRLVSKNSNTDSSTEPKQTAPTQVQATQQPQVQATQPQVQTEQAVADATTATNSSADTRKKTWNEIDYEKDMLNGFPETKGRINELLDSLDSTGVSDKDREEIRKELNEIDKKTDAYFYGPSIVSTVEMERKRKNADRETNRTGTQDANGQIDSQGVVRPDTTGTAGSNQAGESIQTNETEATTTGDSQSNTGIVENTLGEQNNNQTASDTTGVDGRTEQTDGRPVERGELRETGVKQDSNATQTASTPSENSGVQQRTESDSSRKALADSKDTTYKERPKQKVDDPEFKIYSGGALSDQPWGSMSSNLAYGYARKSDKGNQVISTLTPKKDANVRYVVFDGQGKSYKDLAPQLQKTALVKKGERKFGSDIIVNTLAKTGKYDAVILKNYSDLGGISPKGAKNVHHSDTVVVLNKDKFDVTTQSYTDKTDYANGYTLDTEGLPSVTEDELIAYAKQQRGDSNGPTTSDEQSNTTSGTNVNTGKRKSLRASESTTNKEAPDSDNTSYVSAQEETTKSNVDTTTKVDNRWNKEVSKQNKINAAINAIGAEKTSAKKPVKKPVKKLTKALRQKQTTQDLFNAEDKRQLDWLKEASANGDKLAAQTVALAESLNAAKVDFVEDAVKTYFDRSQNTKDFNDLSDSVREYLGDDEKEFTYRELAEYVVDKDFAQHVEKNKPKLVELLNKLRNFLFSIIAAVSISVATVPNDAYAATGHANYTTFTQTIPDVSKQASDTINWVVQKKDHRGKNFVVADKDAGKIYVVSPSGKILNTQNAIFGRGKGNTNADFNTPSGRFFLHKVTKEHLSRKNQKIYGDSLLTLHNPETGKALVQPSGGYVAMHRVLNKEGRLNALSTPTASDNYISFGCINVPTAFYDSAVDGLDNAMVYVLDHQNVKPTKAAKQATTNVVKGTTATAKTSTDVKPVMTKAERQARVSQLQARPLSPLAQRYSISELSDYTSVDTGLTKNKLADQIKHTFGDFGSQVVVIDRNELAKVTDQPKFNSNGIEGMYDPVTDQVYIVADNIQAQGGLTAEQRATWVAWHELTHKGVFTKHGDELNSFLDLVYTNPVVSELANAISAERSAKGFDNQDNIRLATEEAIAELNAAKQTGEYKALEDRYGVKIPNQLRGNGGMLSNILSAFKDFVKQILGIERVSDRQLSQVLQDLVQRGEPITPQAQEVTNKLRDDLFNPNGAYANAVRYSLSSYISDKIDTAKTKLKIKKTAAESVGQVSGQHEFGKSHTDEQQRDSVLSDYLIESFVDSQYQITKALGGTTSTGNLIFKRATNAISQQQHEFNKDIETWSSKVLEKAFDIRAKSKGKLYGDSDSIATIYTAIQELAVARYALTGGNTKEIREHIYELLNGRDVADENGNIDHYPGIDEQYNDLAQAIVDMGDDATDFMRSQLVKLGKERDKLKVRLELFDDRINRIVSGEMVNGKFVPHPDAMGMDLIDEVNSDGEETGNKSVSREGMAFLGGTTNAEAYLTITKAVEAGVIEVEVDGKPWEQHISDIGFTKERGFADKSKDYTLDPNKLVYKGELADVINGYVAMQKQHYSYMTDNGMAQLQMGLSENPYAVSTSGKVDNFRTVKHIDADGNVTFRIQQDKSLEAQTRLDEAVQWQNQRQGRSFTSNNALQQLSFTSSLAARQVGFKEFADHLEYLAEKSPEKVRKIYASSDLFNQADGIIRQKRTKGGAIVYYKLSFRNNDLNDAMFGRNRSKFEFESQDSVLAKAMFAMGALSRFKSVMLTSSPVFAIWNSKRGYSEKTRWLLGAISKDSAFLNENPHLQGTVLDGVNPAKLSAVLYKNGLKQLTKLGPSGVKAAINFARFLNNPTQDIDRYRPNGKRARAYFDRLVEIHEKGGITHRADLIKSRNSEILQMIPKTKLSKKTKDLTRNLASKALTLTSAGEFLSTLAFVDVLKDLGISEDKAIGLNLVSMNFNDSGASKASLYVRRFNPFANAQAQGFKALGISLNSKRGKLAYVQGVGVGLAAYGALSMLASKLDCDSYNGRHPWDNVNSYEVSREMPLSIACSTVRLPVAYGSRAIEWATAFALGQILTDRWSPKQATEHFLAVLFEQASVVPTSTWKGTFTQNILDTAFPYVIAKAYRVSQGYDDFYNSLLPFGIESSDENLHLRAKATTDPWMKQFAEFMGDSFGIKMTGDQWAEMSKIILDGFVRDALIAGVKQARGDEDASWLKVGMAALGTKAGYRPEVTEQQYALRRIYNAMDKYSDVRDRLVKATIQEFDINGDGVVDGKLSLAKNKGKAGKSKRMILNAWLDKQQQELSPKEFEVLQAMINHTKAMNKARAIKDLDVRNESYNSANIEFMKALDRIEGKTK